MPHRITHVVLGVALAALLLGGGATPAGAAVAAGAGAHQLLDEPPVDSDGDGVYDDVDSCPSEPGVPEYNGCPVPDSDGDGLTDDVDSCPFEYGDSNYGGCPYVPPPTDSDGDGTYDDTDLCPSEPGPPERNGCPVPDSDGDGLPDDVDACPDLPGPYDGCPLTDLDGDGVYDDGSDLCPNEYGLPEYSGCPAPDSDGDGLTDDVDQCDDTPPGAPIDELGCSLPVVTAAAPTFSDVCGKKHDTLTVPTSTGVDYLRSGAVVAAGSYRIWSKVTVLAQAADGYVLSGEAQWSATMTDKACPQGRVKVRSTVHQRVRIVNREAVEMTIHIGSTARRLAPGQIRTIWHPSGVTAWTAKWKSPLIATRSGTVNVL